MAANKSSKRYGNFEYGDVYDYDKETGGRGAYLGRLYVDQDNQRFFVKPDGKAAKGIPHDRVNWMLANHLIEFDHEESREFLIDYMMRLEHNRTALKNKQRNQYASAKATKQLKENTKLIKKTRRRARISKLFWSMGCLGIIGVGFLASIPTPEPAPAEQSIAGIGMQYPVDGELLKDATYMQAFGNGSELYGIVVDNNIVESGQQNSNEATIKENVLINAAVSQSYPIHMRPLYYDRSAFYQSQLIINDAEQGSSGILLQNPNGYSLGKAANELVLFGGRGMSSIVLSSPEIYQAATADETAREIERAQQEAIREAQGQTSSSSTTDDYIAGAMPVAWNGYDAADIDSKVVAASYWYTRDSSYKKEDLKRRVAIWDIDAVYNQGASGVNQLSPIQLNYQDKDSDFYSPIISMSPSSNGSTYWLGYTKKSLNGNTGFFIRQYENAEDILLESYDNTFSTKDLTGNDFPITNYQLHGDRLFFEQQGYIWVMDLSKASIEVEGTQRLIKKENPMRICKSSEIRPSVTRDEQFIASVNNTNTVPVSHYQVVTMTTTGGQVVYGIAFIEADSGNLVFQPCNAATVAAATENTGAGGDSTSLDVYSSDQAAIDKAQQEEETRNQEKSGQLIDTGNESQVPEEEQLAPGESRVINSTDTIVEDTPEQPEDQSQQPPTDASGVVPFEQSAYTLQQVADEESVDNGRILIKAGSPDIQIVCFCVRGEQFYWIEQESETKQRAILCSPIYYKNDASKLESDVMEEIGDNGEVVKGGIQPDEGDKNTQATSGDVALDANAQKQDVPNGEQKPAEETAPPPADTQPAPQTPSPDPAPQEPVPVQDTIQ